MNDDTNGGADRFRELDRLFQAVCDLPERDRPSRLEELAPTDAAIREEVLRLLDSDASGSLTPERMRSQVARTLAAAEVEPEHIASFRITGKLGTGGMGVVYEAEQDRPKRSVALKVLRPGLATPEMIRRFEFEADALGRLRHPAIASIYEAGVADTPAGPRPYFAMELVRGEPLDKWAAHPSTTVDDRLALFARVCDAVQHAHAQGVIHRDIKPANILVDGQGSPKILDFGVARAAGDPSETIAPTQHTSQGQLVGTVPYMSPEQVAGEPGEVDTRTDVYCLGVVLHEMLAGELPYDVEGLAILEAARVIAETPPARLSSANARLRGDVETIVGKALSKDKSRRYQTAEAMGEDIRRHLSGLTIAARPPSAMYQFSRFAKRNRLLVGAGTAVTLAVMLGFAGTATGLVEARRQAGIANDRAAEAERQTGIAEEQRAEAERSVRISESVLDFLNNDVLAAVAPQRLGKNATVMEALGASAETISDRFEDEPVIQAAILNNIGNVYHAMGEFAKAESLVRMASNAFDEHLGEDDELSIDAMSDLGNILRDQAKFADAENAYTEVRDRAEHALGPAHEKTLQVLIQQAELILSARRDHEEALALLDEFDIRRQEKLPDDDANVLYAESTRGLIALDLEDYEMAERAYRKVLRGREMSLGPDHPSTLVAVHNVATSLEALGRYEEAEPMYERVLDIERDRSGPDHPDVLVSVHNLAFLRQSMGRYDEAEPLYLDTLERCKRVFGETHPGTLTCTNSLASLYRKTGRADEAYELLRAARERASQELPPMSPPMIELTNAVAVVLAELDRHAEAAPLFEQAAAALRFMLPAGHPELGILLSSWGVSRYHADDHAGALEVLTEAHSILSEAGVEEDAQVAAARLARTYDALGYTDNAAIWRERAGDHAEDK